MIKGSRSKRKVKRDAVDAYFQFPPGISSESVRKEYVEVLDERMKPFMAGTREPALKNYYILTWPGGGGMGVRALDQSRVGELQTIIRDEIFADLPDLQAFASQGNLFGGFGGDREISIHLQAKDRAALAATAEKGQDLLREVLPDANVRVSPGLSQAEPELRLLPDDRALAEIGWSRESMGNLVRALGNGLYVGEHFDGEKRIPDS